MARGFGGLARATWRCWQFIRWKRDQRNELPFAIFPTQFGHPGSRRWHGAIGELLRATWRCWQFIGLKRDQPNELPFAISPAQFDHPGIHICSCSRLSYVFPTTTYVATFIYVRDYHICSRHSCMFAQLRYGRAIRICP